MSENVGVKKKRGTHAASLRGTGIPLEETGKPTLYIV